MTLEDQFVFGAQHDRTVTASSLDMDIGMHPTKAISEHNAEITGGRSLQCRRAQIQALNDAKREVEEKLRDLFREEARHFIFSVGHMSKISNERLICLLAHALHTQVTGNWDESSVKPKSVEKLSTALDESSILSYDDGEVAWLAAEFFNEWEKSTQTCSDDQESAA